VPFSGTSMSTPHVTGLSALIKGRNPTWTAADIRTAITSTCVDLGPPGRDQEFGFGLIDAAKAVRAQRVPSPAVSSASPEHARAGTTPSVAISGSGLTSPMDVVLSRRGEHDVTAAGVKVTDSTRLTCTFDLADVQPGLWDVMLTNKYGKVGVLEGGFEVDPANDRTWYLAEGSTGHGFEEYILVQNSATVAAHASMTFMTPSGPSSPFPVTVPPDSRVTVRVNDIVPGTDVSTRVEADRDIICERSMYWGNRIEGTDSIGVQAPSYAWYLAEGTTAHGFDTFLLVQNPGDRDAEVDVTYMTPEGPVPKPAFTVPAGSRRTINVGDDLPSSDVSIKVVSDKRVIAERSMYWDGMRGGHDSIGTSGPARRWFLAEGSTDYGFDEWVLLENPGGSDASVGLTYMTPEGPMPQPALVVPAGSRRTVHVNDSLPSKDVSVEVTADRGIVVERAMYWNNGTGKGGHETIGVPQARRQCFLAEGSTDYGFDEWVLIQNPNDAPADIGIEYMTPLGPRTRSGFTIAPNSRATVHVNDDIPGTDASTLVYSNLPVIAERSMYWHSRGAGHVSVGVMR
jgi:hypothetical protein